MDAFVDSVAVGVAKKTPLEVMRERLPKMYERELAGENDATDQEAAEALIKELMKDGYSWLEIADATNAAASEYAAAGGQLPKA